MPFSIEKLDATFLTSVKSVGTACILAMVGIYLHRRSFVDGQGKRTLALISQQVTIPLFLFTNLVGCYEDPCQDVVTALEDGWILLLWPVYVVGWGLIVGYIASIASNTPMYQRKAVWAACAFGNSAGLPISLLTVIRVNTSKTATLGTVDPAVFLSIFLLTYHILQWGVGGWLLAPEEQTTMEPSSNNSECFTIVRRNVLNNNQMEQWYSHSRLGIGESDASMYISSPNLVNLDTSPVIDALPTTFDIPPPPVQFDQTPLYMQEHEKSTETTQLFWSRKESRTNSAKNYATTNLCDMIQKITSRCFQPPVLAALLGLIVTTSPMRGLFVAESAPLEWLFNALNTVGQAAVPLNMIVLGCNLSQSLMGGGVTNHLTLLSNKTMVAIVIGKMVVMPIIGIVSILVLQTVKNIQESTCPSLYLVAMIVCMTPTANNIMIMVELSGSGINEGIAKAIALQYALAPLLLSFTMTLAVGVANQWT